MRTIGLTNVPLPYKNENNERPVSIASCDDSVDLILKRLGWVSGKKTNLVIADHFGFSVLQQGVDLELVKEFFKDNQKYLATPYWLKIWLEEFKDFPKAEYYPYFVLKTRRKRKVT